WHPIYSSSENGLSFNRLLSCLLGYEGSTILVITDVKTGGVFGAFTSSSSGFKESAQYDTVPSDTFLFSLHPTFKIMRACHSSSQRNYVYLNSKARSKGYDNLPWGLGFGGSLEGGARLWISEDLEDCRFRREDLTFQNGSGLPEKPKLTDLEMMMQEGFDFASDEDEGKFEILNLEVFAVGGEEKIEKGLEARRVVRQERDREIQKARKVDKAQFYDDLSSGLFESKAFAHKDQVDRSRT
ncbi:hypothetical protein ScalyP_jg1247, partial [Parmales sp. scaly parma]